MSFANPRTLIRDLAGAIIAKERFARNGGGVLYVYRDGVYRSDGEMLILPQQGKLLLRTELGILEVAPGELAVIPRGIKFRALLPDGSVLLAGGWI